MRQSAMSSLLFFSVNAALKWKHFLLPCHLLVSNHFCTMAQPGRLLLCSLKFDRPQTAFAIMHVQYSWYCAVCLAALYLADIFLDLELQIVHVVRLPLCATCMDHKELQGTADRVRSSWASFDPWVHALLIGEKNQYMLLNWNVIALGHQGLQEEIKLVPMDMADKPAWYKKVYPKNEVRLDSRYM